MVLHVFLEIENKLQVAELTLQASDHAQLVSEETVDIKPITCFCTCRRSNMYDFMYMSCSEVLKLTREATPKRDTRGVASGCRTEAAAGRL